MNSVLVLDVVGMTPELLAHTPRLQEVAASGWQAPLETVLPAVTCTVQSTFVTGSHPAEHGAVANGWYFRDLGEIYLWRQHNRLVQGEKVWETARRTRPELTVANVCWWYAMGASTDYTVTPRPIYHADGRKSPDCYTRPPELHDELTAELGPFPLFQYWGPTASLASSEWIVQATRRLMPRNDLTLAYVPHLDYDLQRHGPNSPQAARAAAEVDRVLTPLLDDAWEQGVTVVALSEYGITRAERPVHVNRILREAGFLEVYVQAGMEYLDPWASRAFAVADHQVAHVYVRDAEDLQPVASLLGGVTGVDQVLDRAGQAEAGLDHERSGELVLVAEQDAWFTYYYWLSDDHAPDFARGVEIHRKPGFDPAELFFDPDDPRAKLKAGLNLVKKRAGLRYAMNVVPTDPRWVGGTHGRLPADPQQGPVLLCSDPSSKRSRIGAVDVRDLILDHLGASPEQT